MKTIIAVVLYHWGVRLTVSTFIDEDTITAGYGQLYADGCFQYPLPPNYIRKIYGCTKWSNWHI